VAINSGKRLSAVVTLILGAGAAGVIAHRVGGIDAAQQHVSGQSAAQHLPSVASPAASAYSFGARITAAIEVAEAVPHGDIGTAAVATRP
jgi:hypothetical protein